MIYSDRIGYLSLFGPITDFLNLRFFRHLDVLGSYSHSIFLLQARTYKIFVLASFCAKIAFYIIFLLFFWSIYPK